MYRSNRGFYDLLLLGVIMGRIIEMGPNDKSTPMKPMSNQWP